jgi:ribonuclease HI
MEYRVESACHKAITRLATLPLEHPLHTPVKKSAKGRVKRHRSSLHILTSIFGIDPKVIEKIPLVCTHPKERGSIPVRIDIPPNKEASKRADANATETIKVYSDGSVHDGKVGAAAILKRAGKPDRVLKIYLGTTEQHTVYEAELAGMLMGLHLIKTESMNKVKFVLNVDNQAALGAIQSGLNKSGQHIAVEVLKSAKQLNKNRGNSRFKLTFRWSAGHVGIKGNEAADKEAKEAADGVSSNSKDLPPYLCKQIKYSLSAIRQAHNEEHKKCWKLAWSKSPRYKCLRFKDTLTPSSQKFLAYISNQEISRKNTSHVFQLRVGHSPLNQYLHRFKRVDNL